MDSSQSVGHRRGAWRWIKVSSFIQLLDLIYFDTILMVTLVSVPHAWLTPRRARKGRRHKESTPEQRAVQLLAQVEAYRWVSGSCLQVL